MIKVNVMAKLNTVPDTALREIEEYLDIWTFKWKTEEMWKIDSRIIFDIKSKKKEVIFDSIYCFSGICDFCYKCDIFLFKMFLC